jgi:hypothetical protein
MATLLINIILGTILILWGLANLFYGYRIYRVLLLDVFGLLGASVGLLLTREAMFYLQILAAGVGSFIFGLAAYYLYKFILILAGGLILAIVAITPAVQFYLPESIAWILAIGGFVVGCGLAYFFKQYTVYLISDDEVLGAAGLMMKAVEKGIEVRVVMLTNGDGFPIAAGQEVGTLLPSPQDFVDLGNQRQGETIDAVGVLGVLADKVTFLGYPDAGTPSMWYENWAVENPYESDFTHTSHSPNENTYNPESVHAGEDMLGGCGRAQH